VARQVHELPLIAGMKLLAAVCTIIAAMPSLQLHTPASRCFRTCTSPGRVPPPHPSAAAQALTIEEIRQRRYAGSSAPGTPQSTSTDTSFAPAPASASVNSDGAANATSGHVAGGELAQADGGETNTPTRTPADPDTDPEADKTGLPPAAMAARGDQGGRGLPPMGAGSGEWLSDLIRAQSFLRP
jgi:hypothetical protein